MKTERDKIASKARDICADADTKALWVASWNRVIDHLEPFYRKRPGIRMFEVHHSNEVAREAFLRAAVSGTLLDECERIAIAAVVPR